MKQSAGKQQDNGDVHACQATDVCTVASFFPKQGIAARAELWLAASIQKPAMLDSCPALPCPALPCPALPCECIGMQSTPSTMVCSPFRILRTLAVSDTNTLRWPISHVRCMGPYFFCRSCDRSIKPVFMMRKVSPMMGSTQGPGGKGNCLKYRNHALQKNSLPEGRLPASQRAQ